MPAYKRRRYGSRLRRAKRGRFGRGRRSTRYRRYGLRYGRRRRRRRLGGHGIQRVPRSMSGSKQHRLVKLRTVHALSLNPGASQAIAEIIIRANDARNPWGEMSDTTTQPFGWDQIAAQYEWFTVLGSRCHVQFRSHSYAEGSTSAATEMYVGVIVCNDSAGGATRTVKERIEGPERGRHVRILGHMDGLGAMHNFTRKYSGRKMWGRVRGHSDHRSDTTTGNPVRRSYFIPWAAAVDSTADPGACLVLMQVEYIVLFEDRIPVAHSS